MSTLICKKINFFIFSVSVPFYYILHYMNCKDFCYFPLLCLLLRFSVLKYKNNRAISLLIFAAARGSQDQNNIAVRKALELL